MSDQARAPSRRQVLVGALAAAAVVAFDPIGRRWATAAEGVPPGGIVVPDLDGELTTDPAALAAASTDWGNLVRRTPAAVLRPGSVEDIVRMVRYANDNGLQVAVRGQGHMSYGQALVSGGVVIDSRTLATIHRIDGDRAVVDAGVRWVDLVRATLPLGLTPPVLIGLLVPSVGGTLSVGGIGGTSQDYGLQVDNVLELEVVTGRGELRTCSPTRSRGLFEAVLGGLGQFGIITRATIPLVPAPRSARTFRLTYPDLRTYLADQRRLIADGRFSSLEGDIRARADGTGYDYVVDAAAYYQGTAVPDTAALLAGLSVDPAHVAVGDLAYFDWVNRGSFRDPAPGRPRVQQYLFLPDGRTEELITRFLAERPAGYGLPGRWLLWPFRPTAFTRPFVQAPAGPVAFILGLLRTTATADPELLLADAVSVHRQVREAGGFRYPAEATPFTPEDWRDHYGPDWPAFRAAKAEYDPRRVLSPGHGIFEAV